MPINTTEILAAINTRLTTDAPLIAIVPPERIKTVLDDSIPGQVDYPMIRYQIGGADLEVKQEQGFTMTLQIESWSSKKSALETLQIRDAVQNALDGIPLTIASADCFGTLFDSFDSLLEPSGEIYRGTILFTLLYGEL